MSKRLYMSLIFIKWSYPFLWSVKGKCGWQKDWDNILTTYRPVLSHQELRENNEWFVSQNQDKHKKEGFMFFEGTEKPLKFFYV